MLLVRNNTQTDLEVTVHGSNNKIQTANSEDECWSIRKVKLKVLFFTDMGFFPCVFHYSFCSLRVTRIFYQTETAKEQEYLLIVGSRKKRI